MSCNLNDISLDPSDKGFVGLELGILSLLTHPVPHFSSNSTMNFL